MTYTLAIHGGAGTLLKSRMTEERAQAYHRGLAVALKAGEDILKAGGSALDAVTAAVCALEDEPLFNAGHGAVYTSAGTHEMDAAIMDGATRRTGAVAGICGPRNPIRTARAVMEEGEYVFMIGDGAHETARRAGLAFEDSTYFDTADRHEALQAALELRQRGEKSEDPSQVHGTVGAVACDSNGNVAAATSTGGMTAKAPGRVGDSPVIGAGTFADNATCAVSATGHGEVFVRYTAASEIAALMRYKGESLSTACDHVVNQVLAPQGGSGGLIAVDSEGNVALPFNCEGMYRGFVSEGEEPVTRIYA